MKLSKLFSSFLIFALLLALMPGVVFADSTSQSIPFTQNWSNTGLITADNDWSGVPGIIGYRGDGLTSATGVDPQTILADGSSTPVNVIANQTNPDTFFTGGVAEFEITDASIALNGSGTADAPHIVIYLNTTGQTNVTIAYNVRDLDGSSDDAIQQVALQYRVGNSGNFTNLPAGYIADATSGPSLATLITPVNVQLPAAAENQPDVQVRVITTNAAGNDEWVGIDDINITGTPIVGDTAPFVANTTPADSATNVAVDANVEVTFNEGVNASGAWFDITCTSSGSHTASGSGGPTTFTLDPDVDFDSSETCTVTIFAAQVTDQDSDDPPDNMNADYAFSFDTADASGPAVFFNEIHYDNTGTDAGEAIEIAGPTCTDLTGWSIVLYNGSGGAVYDTTALNGPIPDLGDGFGVLVVNYPSNGIQNGSPDGMALVDDDGNVIQFLSYEGVITAVGGPADGMVSVDIGVSEASSTPVGFSLQLTGSGSTYDNFTWASAAANTFAAFNTGQTFTGGGSTNPCGIGVADPSIVFAGDSTVLTVDVIPGTIPSSTNLAVSCDLSPIGGSATQMFFDDGTNGDETAGDGIFSYQATVGAGTTISQNNLLCTISDAEARSGSASISLNVILPIGTVQGLVGNTDNGLTHRSSYAPPSGTGTGQTVVIQGVIYEKTLARTSSGGSQNGFFIQNTAATADGDPNSSDGIFVFMGGFSDLIGGYVPQVGDEIVLQGRVSEFFSLTELSSARALQVIRNGVDLDAELPAIEVDPPDNLADANRYWERHEGMRVQVPADSIVIDSRDVFASTADGEIWLARGDSEIAQRADPYARRAFRDPHPLDNDPALFDDGNGYRIILGSLGVKAAASDNTVLISPARTYDTMTNAPIGGVFFSFSKYQIMVEQQPELIPGVNPALNAPPQLFDRDQEYSLAPYNVENLYDRRDDPFDGCDFTGNDGCPGVDPPFDYVPASDAVYQAHLDDIAQQIITDLHGPDILFVQEAEDQDICMVTLSAMDCSLTDDSKADGKPDTLQELAVVIAGLGGPAYDAAYDRDGADDRGIVSAFLYRTDRVELLPASTTDPVLGSNPAVDYRGTALDYNTDVQNPKALNAVLPDDVNVSTGQDGDNVFTRPPQVGLFRIWRDTVGNSTFVDIYTLSNHFSSTPNARVGQRTEQARYDAAIVDALQAANPDVSVAVAGDFNVYPRPDDPFEPGHPLYPSDQLGPLYNQGLNNLFDVLVADVPVSAYSYIFQGQTQTLDQIFVTSSLLGELVQARAAHVNSDWPADFDGDGPRGASDHDPLVARYTNLPTIDKLEALVQYFADNGMITGNNTTHILLDRLEKARRFQENGKFNAYLDQLQAFIDQVYDFTPQFITQEAADALTQEAALLKSLP